MDFWKQLFSFNTTYFIIKIYALIKKNQAINDKHKKYGMKIEMKSETCIIYDEC